MNVKEFIGLLIMISGCAIHIYSVEVLGNYMLLSWIIAISTYVLGMKIISS